MLRALIFDVDGTLADTEELHRQAFNAAFAEVGRDWHWDSASYTQLLNISGGKERILHYWRQRQPDLVALDGSALQDSVERMHALKLAAYERMVQDGAVQLRPGVLSLIEAASAAGLRLAIATTTSPANIGVLLRSAIGPDWRHHFQLVEDASTAARKKPHPQVYRQTLERLQLPASACLAFEDSANGLQAALGAGLATIVTPTGYTAAHDFSRALRCLPSLAAIGLAHLREWTRQAQACAPAAAG